MRVRPETPMALRAFIHILCLLHLLYCYTALLLYCENRGAGRKHRKTAWRLSVGPAYGSVDMSQSTEEVT